MIRDVNATSQAVAEAAVLKAHHLWTLGLFHRTLTAPLSSEPETVFPSTLNLPSSDQSGWVLAEVVMTAVKGEHRIDPLISEFPYGAHRLTDRFALQN